MDPFKGTLMDPDKRSPKPKPFRPPFPFEGHLWDAGAGSRRGEGVDQEARERRLGIQNVKGV